jgi:hypothetical protein
MKKSTFYLFSSIFVLFTIVSLAVLQGCNDKDEPAPQLPPESTFIIDFSDFQDADTTTNRDTETYKNWWWAATNGVVWNTFIAVNMVVPVAAFREAFNHEAIYDPDTESWTWSYNFWVGTAAYLASLHASLMEDGVKWEMFISKDGSFSNFLWYSGVSSLEVTEGTWILYHNPQDPIELVEITWHRNPDNGTGDIKYLNIVPGGAENGGYIYYGLTTDTPYNAFYNIYNKGQDNLTGIQWNRTTKEGRVNDPDHFGDSLWHCWDQQLQDTDCQ